MPQPPSSELTSAAIEPAPLFRRLAALVYDAFLVAALVFAFTFLVVVIRGAEVEPGSYWLAPSVLGVAFAFYAWFWTHGGQTLGMRAWRIKVVRADGGPLAWRHAATRFAAAWLSFLPLGLGYWWSLFDREGRSWHDRLSGTRTVREAR